MKKITILLILIVFSLTLNGCSKPKNEDGVSFTCNENTCYTIWTDQYFDTLIKLTLYLDEDYKGLQDIFNEVDSIISYNHKLFDKYNDYDGIVNIKTINDNPTKVHKVDDDLFNLIDFSLKQSNNITVNEERVFNIALGPVLKVWHDAREECAYEPLLGMGTGICKEPSQTKLDNAIHINQDDIILDKANSTVSLKYDDMSLDVGGIAKGYMSEAVTDYLDENNLTYIFNAGSSNVKVGGTHPTRENGKFIIGITNPNYPLNSDNQIFAAVYLQDGMSIVTSGDYQRYFVTEDGIMYHHIIDPRTKYPGGEARSVSIFLQDGALADLYSTSIFLMSIDDGLNYVNSLDGIEAVWYEQDGSLTYSENFEEIYLATLY